MLWFSGRDGVAMSIPAAFSPIFSEKGRILLTESFSRMCSAQLAEEMWISYLSSEILGAHQRPFQNRPRGNNHVCIAFLAALYNDMWVYLVFQYSTFPGILSSFLSSVLAPFQAPLKIEEGQAENWKRTVLFRFVASRYTKHHFLPLKRDVSDNVIRRVVDYSY